MAHFNLPPSTPPKSSCISAHLLGLSSAIIKHLLALFSLALFEGNLLLKKTFFSLIFLIAAAFACFIAYLGFLATLIIVAIFHFHLTWVVISGSITIAHIAIAAILIIFLRHQLRTSVPFEMTAREIQRDLETFSLK